MLEFIKRNKYSFILIFLYFLLRLINLTIIPIFNDESIYLDWGWRELHKGVLYYSLYDGKQPLEMWLFGIFEGLFTDPLFAGRIISVFFGFTTMVGLYRLGKNLFDENVGRISAFLYIIIPLFSFFDRLALMESAVASCEIWTIYLFIKLLNSPSIRKAISLGLVLGIGFFIKSTILLLVPAILLAYVLVQRLKQKNRLFLRDIGIAFVTSQIVVLPLYLQPLFLKNFYMNNRYSMGLGELTRFPITIWLNNIWAFLQISFWHLTPFVFIALIVGSLLVFRSTKKEQKILLWIFLIQIFVFLFVAKEINPRYTMPMIPLAILFVASCISYYKKLDKLFIIVLTIVPLYFLILQLFFPLQYFDQLQSLTVYSQKSDYVTGSTAGYAVTQAINYLQLNTDRAIISVRLDAGNPEDAIQTYFHSSDQIPSYLEARIISHVSNYECLSYPIPVYFVSRDSQLAGLNRFLQEEKRFYNPENQSFVGIYRFKSPCSGNTLDLSTPGAFLQPK